MASQHSFDVKVQVGSKLVVGICAPGRDRACCTDDGARAVDESLYGRAVLRIECRAQFGPRLLQVLDQEMRLNSSRVEHARGPEGVVVECRCTAALHGTGEEIDVESRILESANPGRVAETSEPVRMTVEEHLRHADCDVLALRSKLLCQSAALPNPISTHVSPFARTTRVVRDSPFVCASPLPCARDLAASSSSMSVMTRSKHGGQ